MRKNRAKKIEKLYRMIWSSLESHLPYTYDKYSDRRFQKKCVKEYSEMFKILSDLY